MSMMPADRNVPVRPLLTVVVVAMVGLLAVACGDGGDGGPASPTGDNGPPPEVTVVTTLPVFADFVREAGGDRVEVFTILPDGVDPGLVELARGDRAHQPGRSYSLQRP